LAQQPGVPVIGALSSNGATSAHATGSLMPAFRQGLKEAGLVEGQNVAIGAGQLWPLSR
jgi:hypothetical protein